MHQCADIDVCFDEFRAALHAGQGVVACGRCDNILRKAQASGGRCEDCTTRLQQPLVVAEDKVVRDFAARCGLCEQQVDLASLPPLGMQEVSPTSAQARSHLAVPARF